MKKLHEIIRSPDGNLIAVDLDGVLAYGEYWGDGSKVRPIKENIEFFNKLYTQGAHIIVYTARPVTWASITYSWLDVNGVMYHGLMMGKKPGADLYIDDKALNIEEVKEYIKI